MEKRSILLYAILDIFIEMVKLERVLTLTYQLGKASQQGEAVQMCGSCFSDSL